MYGVILVSDEEHCLKKQIICLLDLQIDTNWSFWRKSCDQTGIKSCEDEFKHFDKYKYDGGVFEKVQK